MKSDGELVGIAKPRLVVPQFESLSCENVWIYGRSIELYSLMLFKKNIPANKSVPNVAFICIYHLPRF